MKPVSPLWAAAFTHSSWAYEHASDGEGARPLAGGERAGGRSPPLAEKDNERLEFLGDAVLQLCVTELLFEHFPGATEGEMSWMRQRLVGTTRLAELARSLELGKLVRLGRGEDSSGGRDRARMLAGLYEAVLGAAFLVLGLDAARAIVRSALEGDLDLVATASNPKKALHEWSQAKYGSPPRYEVVGEDGPDHARVFRIAVRIGGQVVGEATGPSKREASVAAAEAALAALEIA